MAENSALAEANFSGSSRRALAKTRGPWRGLEAVNPSGNSERRSEIHFGVAKRLALGSDVTGSGEVGRMIDREVGESVLKTL